MPNEPRIYPMDNSGLSPEQIAVTFARTSRSPEPFDEIAQKVTEESAARFHEQWVVGYGHASVAEHAVVHLAVENVSRVAVDHMEANRLASYTEKSSRYQVIDSSSYHIPEEIQEPDLRAAYTGVMDHLFAQYGDMVTRGTQNLAETMPQKGDETPAAWRLRRRRLVTDAVRNVLPAATLTNVGITANARTLEHAISKLMSHHLAETRWLGEQLRSEGRTIVPTLIKYADHSPYLERQNPAKHAQSDLPAEPIRNPPTPRASMIQFDPHAITRLAAGLMFRDGTDYETALQSATQYDRSTNVRIIKHALNGMSDHDAPPREFETVHYTVTMAMDYGALREFRRHRMMTPLSQFLTVRHGYDVPELVEQLGLAPQYDDCVRQAEGLFKTLAQESPAVAQYAVTHAHIQNVVVEINLRQLYHLVRLRTSPNAHPSIRRPVRQALDVIRNVHPELVPQL